MKSQHRYARNYNCRNRVKPFTVSVRGKVYVRDNVRSTKYEPIWTNPRNVSERLNETTVRLNDGNVRHSTDLVLSPKPQVLPQEEAPLPEPSPLFVAPPIHEPAEPAAISISAPMSPAPQAVMPPTLRRSDRTRHAPARYADYVVGYKPRK